MFPPAASWLDEAPGLRLQGLRKTPSICQGLVKVELNGAPDVTTASGGAAATRHQPRALRAPIKAPSDFVPVRLPGWWSRA